MGIEIERAGDRGKRSKRWSSRFVWVFSVLCFLIVGGSGRSAWAVQRHSLVPEETGSFLSTSSGHPAPDSQLNDHDRSESAAYSRLPHVSEQAMLTTPDEARLKGETAEKSVENQKEVPHLPPPALNPSQKAPVPAPSPKAPSSRTPAEEGHPKLPEPEALPELEGKEPTVEPETELHEEHGVVLPTISPVPGVSFVQTMIDLLDYELNGRTLGWRPNDAVFGRFTDNINNYQLGVLEALRFTTLRLKDSLTRMGDADTYDPDVEAALNLLMNRSTLFWFPSAENSYKEALDHLKAFLVKLETGQRHFYYRSDNLKLLLTTYKDLLGNVNRNLIRDPVSWFKCDDYYYYAKGVSHVIYEILRVVRVGFVSQLSTTLDAVAVMDEILHELHRAEQMQPWIILNADMDSLFANQRANLNAPLSEVAHLLGVLTSF